jgi:calpain-15
MRNPHGHEGSEWNGDWSDASPLWTERMKTLAKGKYSDENDGTFWMNLYDFSTQFAKLYTCKLFDASKWTEKSIEGEWKG